MPDAIEPPPSLLSRQPCLSNRSLPSATELQQRMAAVAKEHGLPGEAGERVGEFVALALDVSFASFRKQKLICTRPISRTFSTLLSICFNTIALHHLPFTSLNPSSRLLPLCPSTATRLSIHPVHRRPYPTMI